MSADANPREYTITELAHATGVSVRNIRAYRNRGLLPAPEKRGRLGIYSAQHASRLRIITELLSRGYSIANTEELLKAWYNGQDIEGVLGLETAVFTPFGDAPPVVYNQADLDREFGDRLTPDALQKAQALDLLRSTGPQFQAPHPQMIEVGSALSAMGFPLPAMLDILKDLRLHMEIAGSNIVKAIEHDMYESFQTRQAPAGSNTDELSDMVWKLRKLVNQAVTSEMERALDLAISQRFGERVSRSYQADPEKSTAPSS